MAAAHRRVRLFDSDVDWLEQLFAGGISVTEIASMAGFTRARSAIRQARPIQVAPGPAAAPVRPA
jgi:hypothetical protein